LNFLDNQTLHGNRTEADNHEQIHIVFNQRLNQRRVRRFLPAAGNDCDDDRSRSGPTDTDPNAQQASQDDCWLGTQAC
jgi:hypothetical protein